MYNHFIQFVVPRIGQALVALVLYLNFLTLPFLRPLAGMPVLFFGLPLVLLAVLVWVARDPLGVGLAAAAQLCGVYAAGDLVTLLAHLAGGIVWRVWQPVWQGGLLAWEVTAVLLFWGWRKAVKLCTTRYAVTTAKPLPGGRLRVVQLSDLHPGTGAMNHTRIPELYDRVEELHPDVLVLTGDIFDEYTSREDFDAFCALFGRWQVPGGKWFVQGNHDFFHYWRTPSYTRAELEEKFAAAGVTILEDRTERLTLPRDTVPVRITGRRDWLDSKGSRLAPAELQPGGPDGVYTLWLDHEPRELRDAADAGADLILSGHTHGGQIWPAGLVARLFRYNEVNYVMKRVSGTCTAVVSGGTGTWGYKLRTAGRTEIVCVDITQKM